MSDFVIDLSNVRDFSIATFPNGWYAARVLDSKLGLSQKSDSQLELKFELLSEEHGTAIVNQNITVNMAFMMKPFWIAVNDLTPEEFAADPNARISDPKRFVDSELLVFLGEKKSNQLDDEGNPKVFKNIVDPFFAPLSRFEELAAKGLVR